MPFSIDILKLVVATAIVLLLAIIAERVSPRTAGIISGYPAGIAINLFFFGLEIGPAFAAESALYTSAGLVATQACVYFYYLASRWAGERALIVPSFAAIAGYLLVILMLKQFSIGSTEAILVPVLSIFIYVRLFRTIPNVIIAQRIALTWRVLLLRAAVAAALVLIVTGAAHYVGPAYAGLFAAFPTTLFPLMVIVHATYGSGAVHTIIKNFPLGLGSLIIYSISVFFTYSSQGIILGTLTSFVAATLYLAGYVLCVGWLRRSRGN
ncbi:MAG TPA: hypothetical protein VK445_06775 [Dissulfurispiraceae bacterium]|nr:hypothetical protein [Dissulfurispiraceae bacterium]